MGSFVLEFEAMAENREMPRAHLILLLRCSLSLRHDHERSINLSIYQSIPQVEIPTSPRILKAQLPIPQSERVYNWRVWDVCQRYKSNPSKRTRKNTKKDTAPKRKRPKWLQPLKINLKHGAKPNTLFAVDKLQTF